jgi:hypothetical protein
LKNFNGFGGGFGAGAALTSLLAAATWFWTSDRFATWLRDTSADRKRRDLDRAARRASRSPGYLDACRAAGL